VGSGVGVRVFVIVRLGVKVGVRVAVGAMLVWRAKSASCRAAFVALPSTTRVAMRSGVQVSDGVSVGLGVHVWDGVNVGLGVKVSVGGEVKLGKTANVGKLATVADLGVHAEKRMRSMAKTIACMRIGVLAVSSLLQPAGIL
jgi:hypothetical protein